LIIDVAVAVGVGVCSLGVAVIVGTGVVNAVGDGDGELNERGGVAVGEPEADGVGVGVATACNAETWLGAEADRPSEQPGSRRQAMLTLGSARPILVRILSRIKVAEPLLASNFTADGSAAAKSIE
jgi:hypothetical protein